MTEPLRLIKRVSGAVWEHRSIHRDGNEAVVIEKRNFSITRRSGPLHRISILAKISSIRLPSD
jgi:hypothetical protein